LGHIVPPEGLVHSPHKLHLQQDTERSALPTHT